MSDERDDDAMIKRAYDAASTEIDERPDARIRANVLAVAARAVDAKPRDLATPRPINPFVARRWPMSLAAVLVVSLMSGLIATRVMREDPDRITTASTTSDAKSSSSSSPATGAATPSAKVERETGSSEEPSVAKPNAALTATQPKATSRAAKPTSDRRERADQPASAKASTSGAATPAPSPQPSQSGIDDRNTARQTQHEENSTPAAPGSPPAALASAPTPAPAPPAPSSAPPSTMFTPAAPPAPAPARQSTPTNAARERDDASASGDRRKTRAPSVNATTYRRSASPEPATPEAWVDRIIKLREAGHGDEADAEVEALRSRYPGFEIPNSALGKPGTR